MLLELKSSSGTTEDLSLLIFFLRISQNTEGGQVKRGNKQDGSFTNSTQFAHSEVIMSLSSGFVLCRISYCNCLNVFWQCQLGGEAIQQITRLSNLLIQLSQQWVFKKCNVSLTNEQFWQDVISPAITQCTSVLLLSSLMNNRASNIGMTIYLFIYLNLKH